MKMTMKLRSPVTISDRCAGCGICVALCPENVLVLGLIGKASALFSERCSQCKLCEQRCPERAIVVGNQVKVKTNV